MRPKTSAVSDWKINLLRSGLRGGGRRPRDRLPTGAIHTTRSGAVGARVGSGALTRADETTARRLKDPRIQTCHTINIRPQPWTSDAVLICRIECAEKYAAVLLGVLAWQAYHHLM
jgi:hypothetical protein